MDNSEQDDAQVQKSLQAVEQQFSDSQQPSTGPAQPEHTEASAQNPIALQQQVGVQSATTKQEHASAGLIVLQWLTYAFWGWLLLALMTLIYMIVAAFLTSVDLSSMIPYAIAATIVLLPLAFVCDFFYSKHEPVKKTGAALAVMVIHTVIFALFGIGSLISAVLLVVQMSISTQTDPSGMNSWITTLVISTVLYALTFLRALNPWSGVRLGRKYSFGMLGLVAVFIVLAFIGPVRQAAITRTDRDIDANLSTVNNAIGDYVRQNNALPPSLSNLQLTGGAKSLVDRSLITYKPDEPVLQQPAKNESTPTDTADSKYQIDDYRYQLCVTYAQASHTVLDSYGYSSGYSNVDADGYASYPNTNAHKAGAYCYKLKTSVYAN